MVATYGQWEACHTLQWYNPKILPRLLHLQEVFPLSSSKHSVQIPMLSQCIMIKYKCLKDTSFKQAHYQIKLALKQILVAHVYSLLLQNSDEKDS